MLMKPIKPIEGLFIFTIFLWREEINSSFIKLIPQLGFKKGNVILNPINLYKIINISTRLVHFKYFTLSLIASSLLYLIITRAVNYCIQSNRSFVYKTNCFFCKILNGWFMNNIIWKFFLE